MSTKLHLDSPCTVKLTERGKAHLAKRMETDPPLGGERQDGEPWPLWELLEVFPRDWGVHFVGAGVELLAGGLLAEHCMGCGKRTDVTVGVEGRELCVPCAAENIRELGSLVNGLREALR